MTTTELQEQAVWLQSILPAAREACRRFGAYRVSLLLAQAGLETGFGRGSGCDSLVQHYNYLGMKRQLLNDTYTAEYWSGDFFPKSTPEWKGGEIRYQDDDFRTYESVLQCFLDYLQFLRDVRLDDGSYKYRDLLNDKKCTPYSLIREVAARGWCTDPSYADEIQDIIGRHGLTRYDTEDLIMTTKPTSVAAFLSRYNRRLIDRRAINRNKGQKHGVNTHRYFAIHFLGCNGENADLWDGCYGAHFYISKTGQIYWVADVGDVLWHVGASSGLRYIHEFARNATTIGVEVATYTASGRNDDEETWYYTEASQQALVILTAAVCLTYDIPLDHVLMHGQITTKRCPMPYIRDALKGPNWSWSILMGKVADCMGGTWTEEIKEAAPVTVSVLRYGHTGSAVTELQKNLIRLGYDCGTAGADGIYGYDTANAVRRFQDDQNITVDGLAGPITLRTVQNALAATEKPAESSQKLQYFVRVGAYGNRDYAVRRLQQAQEAGYDACIRDYGEAAEEGSRWRVQCGAFASRSYAEALVIRLADAGLEPYLATA